MRGSSSWQQWKELFPSVLSGFLGSSGFFCFFVFGNNKKTSQVWLQKLRKHSHTTTVMPPDVPRHYEAVQGPTAKCNEADMRVPTKHIYAHPHTASHSKWERPIYCRATWKTKWNLNPLKNTMKNLKSVWCSLRRTIRKAGGSTLLRFRSRVFSVLCKVPTTQRMTKNSHAEVFSEDWEANNVPTGFSPLSYFGEQCVFF